MSGRRRPSGLNGALPTTLGHSFQARQEAVSDTSVNVSIPKQMRRRQALLAWQIRTSEVSLAAYGEKRLVRIRS